MTNQYLELKRKRQEEITNFPMVFAFSDEQFEKAIKELGFTMDNYKGNVVSFGGGGFIRKTDSAALHEMFERHENELVEAVENDPTGDGFTFDMFDYELSNHEYSYTWDAEPALHALGLNYDDINNDEKLKYAFNKAKKAQYQEA